MARKDPGALTEIRSYHRNFWIHHSAETVDDTEGFGVMRRQEN